MFIVSKLTNTPDEDNRQEEYCSYQSLTWILIKNDCYKIKTDEMYRYLKLSIIKVQTRSVNIYI